MSFVKDVKILFFDIETTGLNQDTAEIWQMSFKYCKTTGDGFGIDILDGINLFIKPKHPELMEEGAAELNNLTVETFNDPKYIEQEEAAKKLNKFLNKHINRFDSDDKYLLSGFNIRNFDVPFLTNFFEKYDPEMFKYYGGYFYRQLFDLYDRIGTDYVLFTDKSNFPRDEKGKSRFNLGVVCKQLKIDLKNAHDADSDVNASIGCAIKMFNLLKKKLVDS